MRKSYSYKRDEINKLAGHICHVNQLIHFYRGLNASATYICLYTLIAIILKSIMLKYESPKRPTI